MPTGGSRDRSGIELKSLKRAIRSGDGKNRSAPEFDFSVGRWSAAVWACPHAMDIGAARVLGPNTGFVLQHWGLEGVVLLNA